MPKNTWKSLLSWSLIFTSVFFTLAYLFSPYMDKSAVGIITVFAALYFSSFFILTITLMIVDLIKEYIAQDKNGRVLMIIILLLAIAYVLPKALADFSD